MMGRRAWAWAAPSGCSLRPHASKRRRATSTGSGILTVNPVNAQNSSSNPGRFLQGLRELGYIEGRDDRGRIPQCWRPPRATLRPGVGARSAQRRCHSRVWQRDVEAARRATQTIPIIMVYVADDPVERGFVANLARPGGNVTGLTTLGSELQGKRLKLLREVRPGLTPVAVLWDFDDRPVPGPRAQGRRAVARPGGSASRVSKARRARGRLCDR